MRNLILLAALSTAFSSGMFASGEELTRALLDEKNKGSKTLSLDGLVNIRITINVDGKTLESTATSNSAKPSITRISDAAGANDTLKEKKPSVPKPMMDASATPDTLWYVECEDDLRKLFNGNFNLEDITVEKVYHNYPNEHGFAAFHDNRPKYSLVDENTRKKVSWFSTPQQCHYFGQHYAGDRGYPRTHTTAKELFWEHRYGPEYWKEKKSTDDLHKTDKGIYFGCHACHYILSAMDLALGFLKTDQIPSAALSNLIFIDADPNGQTTYAWSAFAKANQIFNVPKVSRLFGPVWGTITTNDNRIQYNRIDNTKHFDTFTFVDKGIYGIPLQHTVVLKFNHIPTLDGLDDGLGGNTIGFTVRQNNKYTGQLVAHDEDGDSLTFSAVGANHGTVVVSKDGHLTYTPNKDYLGKDEVTYRADDGFGGITEGRLSVTVKRNNPPTILKIFVNGIGDDIGELITRENYQGTGRLEASDEDGDPLTFSGTAQHGTVVIDANSKLFTYTPNRGYFGTDTIVFKVDDGFGGVAEKNLSVTVLENHPPVTSGVINADGIPDKQFAVMRNSTFTGRLSAGDEDGDPLTFSAVGDKNADDIIKTAHGNVIVKPNGEIIYTPKAGYLGDDEITYQVDDGSGGFTTEKLTVHVFNNAPEAKGVIEDKKGGDPASEVAIWSNNELIGQLIADDMNGDPLTFSMTDKAPKYGSVKIKPDGRITYKPNLNFCTTTDLEEINYQVSDGSETTQAQLQVRIHEGILFKNNQDDIIPKGLDSDGQNKVIRPVANGGIYGEDSYLGIFPQIISGRLHDPLYTLKLQPKYGKVTINNSTQSEYFYQLTESNYFRDPDFHGTDRFTYEIAASAYGVEKTITATGTITVKIGFMREYEYVKSFTHYSLEQIFETVNNWYVGYKNGTYKDSIKKAWTFVNDNKNNKQAIDKALGNLQSDLYKFIKQVLYAQYLQDFYKPKTEEDKKI